MSRTVVTAVWLEELRRDRREIIVPRDALLTPAARDWIREQEYPVSWTDEPSGGAGGQGANGTGRLGVAGDLSRPALRSLRTELERIAGRIEVFEGGAGRDSRTGGGDFRTGGWGAGAGGQLQLEAVQRLCKAIQRGELSRGVVLLEDGAVSACVANKFRGVRACVGNSVPAFDQAVRELGVNVLVIEYLSRTFHEMRQMVRRLVSGNGQPTEAVSKAIAAAETSQT